MLDQIASITIHAGEAHVFVPSQRDPARWYTVRMKLDPQWGWLALSCQCRACIDAPERWTRALSDRKLPCRHTKEARLLLQHREIQGRRWGAQLRQQLEAQGWTKAQIDREVWRLHRVCGGRDVYATSHALSREHSLYTLDEALDAEKKGPSAPTSPAPASYPLPKKEEKEKQLELTLLSQIATAAGVSEAAALAACEVRGWRVHDTEGGAAVLSVYAYRLQEGLILDAWKRSGAPSREAYLREVQDRRVSWRAA